MYRITESTTSTRAEVFYRMAEDKNKEKSRKVIEKSEKDVVKVLDHCLKNISSAAKKGKYSVHYEYSRSILDILFFWQPAIWNKNTLDLLKLKLIEMNFICHESSQGALFIGWHK